MEAWLPKFSEKYMKIELSEKKLNQVKGDCEIIFVVKKNLKHSWVKEAKLLKNQNFKGVSDEIAFFPHKKELYVGVDSLDATNIRIASAQASRYLLNTKFKSAKVGIYEGGDALNNFSAMVEGFLLGVYEFNKYKSKKEKRVFSKIIIAKDEYDGGKIDSVKLKKEILKASKVVAGVNLTRDIVNKTPSDVTPMTMSKIAREIAKNPSLSVRVYGEKYIIKEGMEAFHAVSKASPYEPQLIHLVYKPKKKVKKKIAIVGKGLTYDSGGLSIKPSDSMVTMKMDKSGASAVLGVMKAVSELRPNVEVHGIIGATENVIDKHAYKPDDVLKAKNGKTIEVRNTDAEGRLVLADCLCYAQEENFDYIIDIATLTGACVMALGEYTLGVMGYSRELKNKILEAGERSGELSADLPFNKYLAKTIKSQVADIANISNSRWGGAITAALFLSEFIEEKNKNKWIHLDIAGPAYGNKVWGFNPEGASGSGVKLLLEFIDSI